MKDELVSFKVAKLAKEKDFDEFQNIFYHNNAGGITLNTTNERTHVNFRKHEKSYNAPTQSLLQRWLREEHNIRIGLTYFKAGTFWRYRIHHRDKWGDGNNSYEEALEVGLEEGLKLIKNGKED